MAYKIELAKRTCDRCGKRSTHAVFNGRNAPMGEYCSKCADRKVAEVNLLEQSEYTKE